MFLCTCASGQPTPDGCLTQAVLVVEAAQRTRPRSAPIRLAAMSLRGLLGAAPSAMESFDALDIKHIQHDTLSGERPGADAPILSSGCPVVSIGITAVAASYSSRLTVLSQRYHPPVGCADPSNIVPDGVRMR